MPDPFATAVREIMGEHDLTRLDIGHNEHGPTVTGWFDNNLCQFGSGHTTDDALANLIVNVAAKRQALALAIAA